MNNSSGLAFSKSGFNLFGQNLRLCCITAWKILCKKEKTKSDLEFFGGVLACCVLFPNIVLVL